MGLFPQISFKRILFAPKHQETGFGRAEPVVKSQSITMLSIDDRSVTADLDSAGYKKMGVVVRTATSWDEAEKFLNHEAIDVLVINLDYRRVDGAQIIRHIRSIEQFAKLPVVVTSVQAANRARSSAIQAGADLFVEQPVPRQFFIEKLKSLLSQTTRSASRIGTGGEARFVFDGKNVSCPLGDVSIGGVLLQSHVELTVGAELKVELVLPGVKKPVEISGRVVRKVKGNIKDPTSIKGFGFRIDSFHGDGRKRLEKFVAMNAETDSPMRYYL
jgi:CheY-like chemotaxis protein